MGPLLSIRGNVSESMTMDNTVEELDDVGKVHAVINDNLSVILDERKSYKQNEMRRADVPCHPYRLPDHEDIVIN